jgi:hypothetical protein
VPIAGGVAEKASGPIVAGGYIDRYRLSTRNRAVYSAAQRSETVELFASSGELTARFPSQGGSDGWVLESTETSGAGRTLSKAAATLYVGDDALDRQYRSVLSFDTATLPDDAVLLAATLRLRRVGVIGTLPFSTHGGLLVDIRTGVFSTSAALQAVDFKAAASGTAAARVSKTAVANWHTATLGAAAQSYLNRGGRTQMRLRFAKDDNDDRGADVLSLASGNAAAANRPVLEIRYSQP